MLRALTIAVGALTVRAAAAAPAGTETVVFASPSPGSAVGLLSQVIKEKRLDERNGLVLEVKYFDPAATEQAVVLRRADAGVFPVVSAARVNLIGEKIRLFAPALINHNSIVLQKGSAATRLSDLKGKRLGTLDRISMTYTSLAVIAKMQGLDLDQDFKLTLSPPPVLMALFSRGELNEEVMRVIRANIRVQGSFGYSDADFQQALDWLAAGKAAIPLSPVRPLGEGPAAFGTLARGPIDDIKVFLG